MLRRSASPGAVAASYLELAGRPVPFERWPEVRGALRVNAPLSSGMGRLFDAVAALLGVRESVTFEGQAAIELELLAGGVAAAPYDWRFGAGADLVAAVDDDLRDGRPAAEIAAAFHETVARASAEACAEAAGEASGETVALSGGSFQNLRLLASTRAHLERLGFRVLSHRIVPPNDGGLSYGQAAVAAAQTPEPGPEPGSGGDGCVTFSVRKLSRSQNEDERRPPGGDRRSSLCEALIVRARSDLAREVRPLDDGLRSLRLLDDLLRLPSVDDLLRLPRTAAALTCAITWLETGPTLVPFGSVPTAVATFR